MKKFVAILSLIIIVLSFGMFGCQESSEVDTENSFVVSIYKIEQTQNEKGIVETTGLTLKDSFYVLSSQGYAIPGFDEGKYQYVEQIGTGYNARNYKYGLWFPDEDDTWFVKERTKKTITFMFNGENIYDKLTPTAKEAYNTYFVDTYEEEFGITKVFNDMVSIVGAHNNIYFSTNKDGTEPFDSISIVNGSVNGNINLIKSTTVYIVAD